MPGPTPGSRPSSISGWRRSKRRPRPNGPSRRRPGSPAATAPCRSPPGALPLVVARSRLGPVDDAGVTLGVGAPAVCVAWFPHCGCDACDSGSQDVLDDLDDHVFGVVSGAFRRLTSGSHEITVIQDGSWQASGALAASDVDAIVADPVGWDVWAGRPWFGAG